MKTCCDMGSTGGAHTCVQLCTCDEEEPNEEPQELSPEDGAEESNRSDSDTECNMDPEWERRKAWASPSQWEVEETDWKGRIGRDKLEGANWTKSRCCLLIYQMFAAHSRVSSNYSRWMTQIFAETPQETNDFHTKTQGTIGFDNPFVPLVCPFSVSPHLQNRQNTIGAKIITHTTFIVGELKLQLHTSVTQL